MLGEKLSLPVHHLDQLYWKPEWVESNKNEFVNKQTVLIKGERWIIDGNYSSTLEPRLAKADTVILREPLTNSMATLRESIAWFRKAS